MASPKVVLITGGNNGIGYETVKALMQSKKAYHILLGSRSLEKAKLAIETLQKECPDSPNTVEIVQVDLTSDESIEKAFKQVKASPGHLDVLINNAGSCTFNYSVTLRTDMSQEPHSTLNSYAAQSLCASVSRNPTT